MIRLALKLYLERRRVSRAITSIAFIVHPVLVRVPVKNLNRNLRPRSDRSSEWYRPSRRLEFGRRQALDLVIQLAEG